MLEDKNENENENKTGADKENLQLAGAVVNKSKTSKRGSLATTPSVQLGMPASTCTIMNANPRERQMRMRSKSEKIAAKKKLPFSR